MVHPVRGEKVATTFLTRRSTVPAMICLSRAIPVPLFFTSSQAGDFETGPGLLETPESNPVRAIYTYRQAEVHPGTIVILRLINLQRSSRYATWRSFLKRPKMVRTCSGWTEIGAHLTNGKNRPIVDADASPTETDVIHVMSLMH